MRSPKKGNVYGLPLRGFRGERDREKEEISVYNYDYKNKDRDVERERKRERQEQRKDWSINFKALFLFRINHTLLALLGFAN